MLFAEFSEFICVFHILLLSLWKSGKQIAHILWVRERWLGEKTKNIGSGCFVLFSEERGVSRGGNGLKIYPVFVEELCPPCVVHIHLWLSLHDIFVILGLTPLSDYILLVCGDLWLFIDLTLLFSKLLLSFFFLWWIIFYLECTLLICLHFNTSFHSLRLNKLLLLLKYLLSLFLMVLWFLGVPVVFDCVHFQQLWWAR